MRLIEKGNKRFYKKERGSVEWVGVRKREKGKKLIKKYENGDWKDNIIDLKECGW